METPISNNKGKIRLIKIIYIPFFTNRNRNLLNQITCRFGSHGSIKKWTSEEKIV